MKISNALTHNIFSQSQRNFAPVMTVTVLWGAHNLLVIGWAAHLKPEHSKYWSNFKLAQSSVSGTGAWSAIVFIFIMSHDQLIFIMVIPTPSKRDYILEWDSDVQCFNIVICNNALACQLGNPTGKLFDLVLCKLLEIFFNFHLK